MNRRGFLRPKALARTAGGVYGAFQPAPGPVTRLELLRVSRSAMATRFEVALPLGHPSAGEAAEDALDLIDDLEAQMTVYRPESEVSRLNATAPDRPIVVEDRLFQLFRRAADLSRETGGAFDIASGALTRAWGFYRRQGRMPTNPERADAMAKTGMRHVMLDDISRSVKYRRVGVEINLGAVGKGYALDRAGERLATRWGVGSALLNGGHSSIRAVGRPPGRSGWRIDLHHPWREGEVIGTFDLVDRGMGTSAATYQYFEHEGRKLGHLLDPRTGKPAEGLAMVAVVAPSAEAADSLSTAFFVAGERFAADYCRRHPEVGAVLLPAEETAPPVTFNLTPGEYRSREIPSAFAVEM